MKFKIGEKLRLTDEYLYKKNKKNGRLAVGLKLLTFVGLSRRGGAMVLSHGSKTPLFFHIKFLQKHIE